MINLQAKWLQYTVAIAMVALGFGIRIWPLSDLGLRIPWGTYYPAVMVGALYGGLPTGLLATILSVLIVLSWSPTGKPFVTEAKPVWEKVLQQFPKEEK